MQNIYKYKSHYSIIWNASFFLCFFQFRTEKDGLRLVLAEQFLNMHQINIKIKYLFSIITEKLS